MFGYVKPVAAELKVKEYELYRAVYCGLCAAMGRCTTCVSKLSLSYDFVFLALVRMALADEAGRIEQRRCIAHPAKKRSVLVDASQLDYCAKVSAVLTYHKVRDDIADERGVKRAAARLLTPAASVMKKKAAGASPGDAIRAGLDALTALEREGCDSPDRAAEPFGEIMAAVCAFGFPEGSAEFRIAREIGRHIGRFLYLLDALDDLPDDAKRGAYNPFVRRYGQDAAEAVKAELPALTRALTMELAGIEAAVELMDFGTVPEYGSIIRNIIYLGLPQQVQMICLKLDGGHTEGVKDL
ncbi:MAG: hypothetical protein J6C52_02750 [Clostridia bacterium]|nr:hypothetical protein [Clostridia bacterium]